MITFEKKLTVLTLNFVFKSDIVDILKTIKGRFWSKDECAWFIPITELPRFKRKIANYNPSYVFQEILSEYQIEQDRLEQAKKEQIIDQAREEAEAAEGELLY